VLSLLDLYARKLQQAERDNAAHLSTLASDPLTAPEPERWDDS